MAEYIEREAALKWFEPYLGVGESWVEIHPVLDAIHTLPAADVVEVRHGAWVWVAQRFLDGGYIDIFRCSECLIPEGKQYRYCPNCGARMDGDKDG